MLRRVVFFLFNKKRILFNLHYIMLYYNILYNFTSVYTNIPSGESRTSFPLQEGIFVYSRVFVQ